MGPFGDLSAFREEAEVTYSVPASACAAVDDWVRRLSGPALPDGATASGKGPKESRWVYLYLDSPDMVTRRAKLKRHGQNWLVSESTKLYVVSGGVEHK